MIAPLPPIPPIGPELRYRLEEEMDRAGRAFERLAPVIQRAFPNRITI